MNGTRRALPRIFAAFFGLMLVLLVTPAFGQGDTWTFRAPMSFPRILHAAGVVDGKLYVVVGGSTPGVGSPPPEVYDPESDTWTTLAPRPKADAGVAEIAGKLYVAGGCCWPPYTAMLEVYDPATDTWEVRTPMSTGRMDPAVGAIGGKLYVAGGRNNSGGSFLNTLEVYDPATNNWEARAPMPLGVEAPATGVIDGKLYAAGGWTAWYGGYNYTGVLQVYDPATDGWEVRASMPTARGSASGGVIGGKLYVAGGATNVTDFATLEEYDPITDTWTTRTPMQTERWGLAVGAINGRLYATGGCADGYDVCPTTLEVYTPPVITVAIDVKPGSDPSRINPKSRGRIPIAILSSAAFAAPAQVDVGSLTFGRTGNEPSLDFCNAGGEDVNGDGRADLVCHFRTQAAGFQRGDTQAVLKGSTISGIPITGSHAIRIVP